MVSRIDIGPDGGPYVEIDESNGDLVIRTPNDSVDFNDEALINIASVAVDSLSTNNDGSIDFSDEALSNISSVATDGVSTNNDAAIDFNAEDLNNIGALEADDSITDPSGYTHDKLTRTLGIPTPTAYFSGPAHGEGASAFRGATLAPDGRVVFAPYDSSNVGIFDPSDDSYTSGPAHGEGSFAFIGATLAPDGRVVFAPTDSSNVGIASQLLDFATASGANK